MDSVLVYMLSYGYDVLVSNPGSDIYFLLSVLFFFKVIFLQKYNFLRFFRFVTYSSFFRLFIYICHFCHSNDSFCSFREKIRENYLVIITVKKYGSKSLILHYIKNCIEPPYANTNDTELFLKDVIRGNL